MEYTQTEFERLCDIFYNSVDELDAAKRKHSVIEKEYQPLIMKFINRGFDLFEYINKRHPSPEPVVVEYNCEKGIHNWRCLWDDYYSTGAECKICGKSSVHEY